MNKLRQCCFKIICKTVLCNTDTVLQRKYEPLHRLYGVLTLCRLNFKLTDDKLVSEMTNFELRGLVPSVLLYNTVNLLTLSQRKIHMVVRANIQRENAVQCGEK